MVHVLLSLDVLPFDMGLVLKPGFTQADTTHTSTSVTSSGNVTLVTLTGKGMASIVVAGNGNSNIQQNYSVDGGADVTITTADIKALISIGFNTSLVIKSKNLDGAGAHNDSDVSWTALYQ